MPLKMAQYVSNYCSQLITWCGLRLKNHNWHHLQILSIWNPLACCLRLKK